MFLRTYAFPYARTHAHMYVDVHVCIFLLYKFAVYNEVMFSCFCIL